MKEHIKRIRLGPAVAILAAAGFAAATGYVLFEDVLWHSAPFTTKHVMTLAVLIGSAYFGDRIVPNWRNGFHVTAAGCLVLAIVGSAFCVFLSSGRTASVTIAKNAEVKKHNSDRKDLQDGFDHATKQRATAAAQQTRAVEAREDAARFAADCAQPAGKPQCKGVTPRSIRDRLAAATKSESDADVRVQRADTAYFEAAAKLQNTQAQQVENPELKASASLFAKFGLGNEEAIEALLAMIVPFAQSLFCEIAFLVSVSNVRSLLGHGSAQAPAATNGSTETDPPNQRRKPRKARETRKLNDNVVRFPVEAKAKAEALAYVQAELEAGRQFPSQDDLAERVGVVKSTISKWAREWEGAGLIPRRVRQGRFKVIRSAGS